MFRSGSLSWLVGRHSRGLLFIAHFRVFMTPRSSMAVGACYTGGPFWFCRCGDWGGLEGLGGTRGTMSSSSMAWPHRSSLDSFLEVDTYRLVSDPTSSSSCVCGILSWICWKTNSESCANANLVSLRIQFISRSPKFSHGLVRWNRQVQHNMSHCGIHHLSQENKPTAGWTCWCCHLESESSATNPTQVSVPEFEATQLTPSTSLCLKHVNSGWTCWCSGKVNNATFKAGFCFWVCEHKGFVATAEFRCNAIIPCMFLKSSDCWSRSNWSCAARSRTTCVGW